MDFKKIVLLAAGTLLVGALWLNWWTQPERQIPRAQARLLAAIERRNFQDMSHMLADNYSDRWQQDKSIVTGRCREVFADFALLTIEHAPQGLQPRDDAWALSEKVQIKGLGGPIALAARDGINALREPFTMLWHQRSWKPWDWELRSVEHPTLELP